MKYSIKKFREMFPTDDACLEYMFYKKYPDLEEKYYRLKGKKVFANASGHQISPLAGTIFHKSSTPLTLWFYAIYLFSQSKNGVSAKELERQLGVTYKCAWRIARQIRSLMVDDSVPLKGVVEVDETLIGGHTNQKNIFKNKTVVMGMVERGGRVKANVISNRENHIILNQVRENISTDAVVMSDELGVYKKLFRFGYQSKRIKHGKKHWVKGDIHTNHIEGFWSQLKRSIRGTYHFVSKKHLPFYLAEFSFRYSYRKQDIFSELISRA